MNGDHFIWRTNAPLSKEEVLQVTDLLVRTEMNVGVAESDSDDADVFDEIQSYKIALAPHKKLPPEVLAIIFVNCITTPIILPPSSSEPALVLASICRSWRNIIFNVPNLWNNIFLDFIDHDPVKLLELAKLWLSLSENTLISLSNSTSRRAESRLYREKVDPITYLVAPYVTRCRKIDLHFHGLFLGEFFYLPEGSIERLEVLYLSMDPVISDNNMSFVQEFGEPIPVFRSAPCLRRFLFSIDHKSLNPKVLGLPWWQLTALHFITTYILPLEIHVILRESTSLLECSLSIIEFDDGLAAELYRLPGCVLPALRSLMVEFSPQTVNYEPFLRPFVLPALTDLELRPFEENSQCPWSQRAYAGLLARSGFTLRRLAILHYMILPADLDTILRGMPSLTDFHLHLWYTTEWDSEILHGLATGALLPALKTLTFSTFPFADLLAALEARVQHGRTGAIVPLKALNMSQTWQRTVSREKGMQFMRLAEDGGPTCRMFIQSRKYVHNRPGHKI